MNNQLFATLTRRTSLMAMGSTGFAALAALAGPLDVKAKKTTTKKKARQKCKNQVSQCITFFTLVCDPATDCLALAERCCPLLGTCDVAGHFTCLTPQP